MSGVIGLSKEGCCCAPSNNYICWFGEEPTIAPTAFNVAASWIGVVQGGGYPQSCWDSDFTLGCDGEQAVCSFDQGIFNASFTRTPCFINFADSALCHMDNAGECVSLQPNGNFLERSVLPNTSQCKFESYGDTTGQTVTTSFTLCPGSCVPVVANRTRTWSGSSSGCLSPLMIDGYFLPYPCGWYEVTTCTPTPTAFIRCPTAHGYKTISGVFVYGALRPSNVRNYIWRDQNNVEIAETASELAFTITAKNNHKMIVSFSVNGGDSVWSGCPAFSQEEMNNFNDICSVGNPTDCFPAAACTTECNMSYLQIQIWNTDVSPFVLLKTLRIAGRGTMTNLVNELQSNTTVLEWVTISSAGDTDRFYLGRYISEGNNTTNYIHSSLSDCYRCNERTSPPHLLNPDINIRCGQCPLTKVWVERDLVEVPSCADSSWCGKVHIYAAPNMVVFYRGIFKQEHGARKFNYHTQNPASCPDIVDCIPPGGSYRSGGGSMCSLSPIDLFGSNTCLGQWTFEGCFDNHRITGGTGLSVAWETRPSVITPSGWDKSRCIVNATIGVCSPSGAVTTVGQGGSGLSSSGVSIQIS